MSSILLHNLQRIQDFLRQVQETISMSGEYLWPKHDRQSWIVRVCVSAKNVLITYTYPHVHISHSPPHTYLHTPSTHTHTQTHMHTCTHMHTHAHTCTHTHTHAHTHAHTHTHTCTHTHTHTYAGQGFPTKRSQLAMSSLLIKGKSSTWWTHYRWDTQGCGGWRGWEARGRPGRWDWCRYLSREWECVSVCGGCECECEEWEGVCEGVRVDICIRGGYHGKSGTCSSLCSPTEMMETTSTSLPRFLQNFSEWPFSAKQFIHKEHNCAGIKSTQLSRWFLHAHMLCYIAVKNHVYLSIYLHTNSHLYTCTHTHTHMHTHTHTHAHTHTHTHTHIHTHTHTHTQALRTGGAMVPTH